MRLLSGLVVRVLFFDFQDDPSSESAIFPTATFSHCIMIIVISSLVNPVYAHARREIVT